MKQGRLILLSAPSGTGKGTVVAQLMRMRTDLDLSISWTTRAPRPGDVEGETYFFKSEEAFQALIDRAVLSNVPAGYGKLYVRRALMCANSWRADVLYFWRSIRWAH
jgi:guanylate kinase